MDTPTQRTPCAAVMAMMFNIVSWAGNITMRSADLPIIENGREQSG
jgi:hypothetical protein